VAEALPIILLSFALLVGILMLPFGLPGLWAMVLALLGYGFYTDFDNIGLVTLLVVTGLAVVGEVLDAWLGFRFARRYGGSSRSGWGAILGGLVGAIVGVPIPLLGSVVGAFLGAFLGAVLLEYTRAQRWDSSVSAGWGAVLGRAAAAAAKVCLGFVIAVIGLWAAFV
jgi:uncharacterized protein YqgC (DUF456 family)